MNKVEGKPSKTLFIITETRWDDKKYFELRCQIDEQFLLICEHYYFHDDASREEALKSARASAMEELFTDNEEECIEYDFFE